MSFEVINLEGKRRKISRVSVDDDVEICEVSKVKKNIPCGIIKKIHLKNVFCHEHLDIEQFIPQLNLLQGANGSGKSSVVAAIIVGLGGSCRATDRGQNIKSLIKNGKNSANIEIHLSNDGYNPYQKDTYGNKIIVERKLTSSGTSSYKIKSGQGAVISTKKEDLVRILEKFNIQVDNPALILSQERAKTFLSCTDPGNLFKFYMTSTQLKHWSDSILDTKNNVHNIKLQISSKKESMKHHERNLTESGNKLKALNSLEENHKKVGKLVREKSWAEIKENEDELEELSTQLSKKKSEITKLREKIVNATVELNELKSQKKANDDGVCTLSEQTESLGRERREADKKFEEAKNDLRKITNQQAELQKEKWEREKDVEILRDKLDKDNNEAKVNWEREMKQLNEENKKLKDDLQKIQLQNETEETHLQNINQSLNKAEEDFQHAEVQRRALSNLLVQHKNDYNNLRKQKDNVTVFGSYMPHLLQKIRNSQRAFQRLPIGPVGNHIKVADKHQEWIHIVEKVLFPVLSAFVVFSFEDFNQLKMIFDQVIPKGARRPRIIKCPYRERVHDVSRYETRTAEFFSMWSIIKSDDIQVANTLLDQCQIESILLIPGIEDAMDLLSDKRRVPANCQKAMTLAGDTVHPDPDYRIYSGNGDRRIRFLQVSVEDRIRDLSDNILKTEEEVENCLEEVKSKNSLRGQLNIEKRKSEQKLAEIRNNKNYCLKRIQELRNREIPAPPNVSQLQNDLEENINLIQDIDRRLIEINNSFKISKNEVEETSKKRKEVIKSCDNIRTTIVDYQNNKKLIEQKLQKKQHGINFCKECVAKLDSERLEIDASLMAKSQSISKMLKDLEKNGEKRITVQKSKEEIEKELKNLRSAIEKQQATYGDVQTLVETHRKIQDKVTQLTDELKNQDKILDEMEKTIKGRERSMALAMKTYKCMMIHTFKQYISKRKLKSHMEINYKTESVKIMTTKDNGSKFQTLQSLPMMSGGEKSFATVSFVLALWDIVISPIRIMDEFDVFMDIVSRKQCIDMITESVKEYAQYIMVTPLECPINSDKVRKLRLEPPERNSFGGSQHTEDEED